MHFKKTTKWILVGLVVCMRLSLSAAPNLIFLKAPQGEVAPDSLLQLSVTVFPPGSKAPKPCQIFHSPIAKGDSLAGHTLTLTSLASASNDSTSVVLTFKPADIDSSGNPKLGLGTHFLVVSCEDGKYVTPELPVWVSARQSASILTPKAEEVSASPNITWTPVPGVPAYHLLLSDQALNIDPEKGTVSGASVIWQAITTKTSIAYGTPDPSGNFSKVPAPPLSPNVPYNLVILNNYDGRSALATSAKAQGLKLFTIKSAATPLSKPKNLQPSANVLLASPRDSLVQFKWNASKSGTTFANTYKVFIYSLETQDQTEVLIPIWQTEVTDTTTQLDARHTLLSKRYIWKVFALNNAGISVVGDTSSFQYRNEVQTLSISTWTLGSTGDTLSLGDVHIEVVPQDGSADALPFFSLNSGFAEKVLAAGGYTLVFSKNGYLAATRTITLDPNKPMALKQVLPTASCKITGRMVDGDQRDLDNVAVAALGNGKSVKAFSDAAGNFLLGVAPGTHAVSFAKSDYQSPSDTIVTIATGKSFDLGKLKMIRPVGSLNGTVTNDKGEALVGCQILVKSATGLVLRTLLSDDKGNFSAFLASGSYLVSATRTGFAGDEKGVQLTDAANLNFQLASGASVVKGRITLLTRLTEALTQSTAAPGALVELVPKTKGVAIQKVASDLRGEFSFSTDTGSYTLKVSHPGRALADSIPIKILVSRSTVIGDVAVRGLASMTGTLTLSPDTVVNPISASVSLLNATTLELVRTSVPESKPVPGGSGNMAFNLEGIPDGKYRLTCGLPGFGLDGEPELTVSNGIWKTDLILKLIKATKSLSFAFTAGGKPTPGSIRLLTPQTLELATGFKLNPAASGTYTLTATPDSATLIPISHYSFQLASTGTADTTMGLDFPFAHQPGPLVFKDQEVRLVLVTTIRIDSALLVYGYGIPQDTLHISLSQLFGPPGAKSIAFNPGPQGGLLTYYFVIHSGSVTYSNEEPSRRFRSPIEPSHALAALRISAGDSLRLPAHSRCDILLHAYDASGNRLDSVVDAKGTVAWSSNSNLPAKIGKKSRRSLPIQTYAPSRALGKRAATLAWDTLHVTVTLDEIVQSLAIPIQVVSAVINKLVVSATLGEVAEIPTPTTFGIFVSAFDTTTTPAMSLVPNPELRLDPPEAGSIKEMRVTVNPRFIGPLRILARHVNTNGSIASSELGAYRDSLSRGLNVGQTLKSGDTSRLLFHNPLFELQVKDSAFTSNNQALLRMRMRSVAKSFSSGLTFAVVGNLYEISNPTAVKFVKAPKLILGIPPFARSRKNEFKQFDTKKLDWKNPKDSVLSETNSFSIPAFAADILDLDENYYGLLTTSQGLSAGSVEIIPNPFSPLVLASRDGNSQYGTRIHFSPETDRSSEVTLSIKIYNMNAELVRHLVEHKTVPKAPVDFYWDGKVDGGRWARNGRYLVKFLLSATGTSEVQVMAKQVVVFQ